jgi:hypothetical protein
MTGKNLLPCGHEIPEEFARSIRTDTKTLWTCRENHGQTGWPEGQRKFYAQPFHWTEILHRVHDTAPPSEQEQNLREQLKAMVRSRLKRK